MRKTFIWKLMERVAKPLAFLLAVNFVVFCDPVVRYTNALAEARAVTPRTFEAIPPATVPLAAAKVPFLATVPELLNNIPPTVSTPPPVTVEATSPAGAQVTLSAQVQDPDCNALTVTWSVDGAAPSRVEIVGHAAQATSVSFTHVYTVGVHPVRVTVSDGIAGPVFANTTVTVRDTTPPQVATSLALGELWPPNHKFVDVGLTITASDTVGQVTLGVTVYSDEQDVESTGSGHFSPDAVTFPVSGPGLYPLFLRSERKGNGDGRVYLIVVTARDSSGNVSFSCQTAVVPKSQSKKGKDDIQAAAAAARATCTATGSPQTPYVVGNGPVWPAGHSPTVEALGVSPGNSSIAAGTTRQYSALRLMSDGTTQAATGTVTWSSSNHAVATIGSTGLLQAITAGTSTITAFSGGFTGTTSVTVTRSGLLSIAVSPESLRLFPTGNQAITATGTYSDGTTQDLTHQVTWASSAPAVATVDATGFATAVAQGTATFSASQSGVSGQSTIEVLPRRIVSIVVSPDGSTIQVGQDLQLHAVATYNDCSTSDITATALWSSAAPVIATVNSGGLVHGTSAGQAAISASKDGVSGSVGVTVNGRRLVSIAVTPPSAAVPQGAHLECRAIGTFSDNTTEDITATSTWATSNSTVLSITSSGVATGASPGASTVSAARDGVSGTSLITVTPPALVNLTVSPARASVTPGKSAAFTATGTYSNATTRDLTSLVTWTSSNRAVGTVNASGLATAISVGQAGITATQGVLSASGTLDVIPAPLVSITVSPVEISLAAGLTQPYVATGFFADGSTQDITGSVIWTIDLTAVASISAAGLATARAQGATTVRATRDRIQGTAILRVLAPRLMSLSITPAAASIGVGATLGYQATGGYSDGTTRDLTIQVGWSSALASVASIGISGQATGVSVGTTTIIAATGGLSAAASLAVTAPSIASISVSPINAAIPIGGTLGYTALARLSDGTTQDITPQATWTSSKPLIAMINAAGSASGLATGITTITATKGGLSASTSLTVTAAGLLSITVSPADASIGVGDLVSYVATGNYIDGSTQNLTAAVTWSTSSSVIATISAAGRATGRSPGAVVVQAAQGGLSGQATLTVLPPSLFTIAVKPPSAALQVQQTLQYAATGIYSDGSTQDLTAQVTWSSHTPSIATISPTGLATAASSGTTQIVASKDGLSGSGTLMVLAGNLASLSVQPAQASIFSGATQQYTATGTLSDGTTKDLTLVVAWSSSDTTLASIDATGLAKGTKEGAAVIRAETAGLTATANLTVTCPKLVSLTMGPSNLSLLPGNTFQLTAQGGYANGSIYAAEKDLIHYWPGDGNANDIVGGLNGTLLNGATADGIGVHGQAFRLNGSTQYVSIPDDPSLNFTSDAAFTVEAWAYLNFPVSVSHVLGKRLNDGEDEYQVAFDPSFGLGFEHNTDQGAVSHVQPTLNQWTHLVGTYDNQRWRFYINGQLAAKETGGNPIPLGPINNAPLFIGRSDGFEFWPGMIDEVKMYKRAITPDEALASFQATNACIAPLLITWTSSDPTVATVNAHGTITAVGPGTTTITATEAGGMSAQQQVTVVASTTIVSIAVAPQFATASAGDLVTFTATGTHTDGSTVDLSSTAAWTSSNLFAASIGSTGKAQTIQPGTTTITATLAGLSALAVLTVGPARLASIALQPAQITLPAGESGNFRAIGTFVGGAQRDITQTFAPNLVLWCPADGNANDIAGNVAGTLVNGAIATAPGKSGQAFGLNGTNQFVQIPTNPSNPRFAFLGSDFTMETWVNFDAVRSGPLYSLPNVFMAQDEGGGAANKWVFYLADGGLTFLTTIVSSNGGQAFIGPAPFTPVTGTWYHVAVVRTGSTFTFFVNGSAVGSGTSNLPIANVNAPVTIGQSEGLGFLNGRLDDVGIWNRALSAVELQKVMRSGKYLLEWTSSSSAQATVNPLGLATGVAPGRATVTAATPDGIFATAQVTVTAPVPVKIEVTPAGRRLAVGRSLQYVATEVFSDSSTVDVTAQAAWSVNDPGIAQVTGSGLANAVSPGQALVAASFGTLTGTTGLTVAPAATTSIAVSPSSSVLPVGRSQQFTATETLSDGSSRDATADVLWSVSAQSVATINATGLVTAVSPGPASVQASKNGVSGTASLSVTGATPVSIAVSPSSSVLAAGQSLQYAAVESFSDGSSRDVTSQAVWSVASPPVASVSLSGLILALAPGQTTLSVSKDGLSSQASLSVIAAQLVSIAVSPNSASVGSGRTLAYAAQGLFSDGSVANLTASVLWKSSDPSVASIDATGLARSLTAGQTTITASMSGVTGATSLTVTGPSLVSIAVSPGGASVSRGLTQQFSATGTYSDGSTFDLTSVVTWTSSVPSVAPINAAGLATALSQGQTQITASKSGNSVSVTLTVTAPVLRQILVFPADASTAAGLRLPYSARGIFSDGSSQDVTATATWTSSDTSIATIAPGGPASALRVGRSTITAASQGITGSTSLTVTAPLLVSIAVSPTPATLPSGQTQAYSATGTYSDGTRQTLNSGVLWLSADSSVASVDATGLARALTAGHTTISASVGSVSGGVSLSVTGPSLVSIAVTPSLASVQSGASQQFVATGTYSNGSTQDISSVVAWTSSRPSQATVAALGLATGVSAGQTLIAAAKDGASAGVVLTVTPPSLRSILVSPANAATAAGLRLSYTAKGVFSDGTSANLTSSVSWSSSDPTTATISAAGQMAAIRAGQVTISAATQGISGSTSLTITAPLLTSLAVSPGSFSATSGQTVQFTARGTYSDGSSQDLTSSVTWSSSDPSVGSVNAVGLARALTAGHTTISASTAGVSVGATLIVAGAALVSIAVSPMNDLIAAGFTRQFSATGTYSDGSTQDLSALVLWTSSLPGVAPISGSGLATAVLQGSTIITAAKDGATTSTALNVSPPTLRSLAVTPAQATREIGQTQPYTAQGAFSDGSVRDVTAQATWTTSDPAIASVSPGGLATALAGGTATISASKDGQSASASLQVIRVVAIAVTPSTAQILVTRTQMFAASGTFSDGTVKDITSSVTWSSSNAGLARIQAPGMVLGVSQGTAQITASREGVTGSAGMTILPAPPPPTTAITSPAADATITEAVDIIGTSTGPYVLDVADRGSADFRTIATSGNPVTAGILGRLDPAVLINGIYTVRLTATDQLGQTSTSTIQLIVDGQVKLGLFTIGFDDLTIPVSGIPVTVTRIYDSRVKSVGDFGIGWNLSVSTLKVRTNTEPGNQGWEAVPNNDFIHTFSLVRTGNHYASITYGDGRTETFDFTPFVENQFGQGLWNAPTLEARSNTTSTIVTIGDSEVILSDGYLFDLSAHVYDPQDYKLTAKDGTVYVLNLRQGIREIHDTNGDVVTISPAGILHSAGVSVPFIRDLAGRITSITDPDGKNLTYTYDIAGNLTSSKDRGGNATTYTYSGQSYLANIVDPVGRRAAHSEYDASGRLVATVDADGNRIEYTHQPDSRQEVIHDRNGNQTVYEYDARGNIVSTTDALGHATTSTYNTFDDETSRTDALGHTTTSTYDGKRNLLSRTTIVAGIAQTTGFTYNAMGRVLTTTDPLRRTTTNAYDPAGNLLTTTYALGHVTSNTFLGGRMIASVDALGTRSEFDYDIRSNVIEQRVKSATGVLLRKSTTTYDGNSRATAATAWKDDGTGTFSAYATTTTVYDLNGKAIEMRDPLGHSTFTSYTAAGQRDTSTDKNGNITRYVYDGRGQLIRTEFPALNGVTPTEELGYDADGNRTSFKDRNGNVTRTQYDAVKRPFKVTNADASFRTTVYDVVGRVQSESNERGYSTSYGYDEVGRRTTVTDPLGKVTRFEYDAAGQQTAVIDALSRRTEYQYDGAGRQIRVTFSDGSVRKTDYDALGRRVRETDEVGTKTEYVYAATGELLEVHQPDPADLNTLSTVTRYQYDSLGRKTAQIDALGRTTTFSYTQRGELLSRARPLGETESFGYDSQGNLSRRTDAMSRATDFAYNGLNLLSSKSFPDGTSQGFTYFAGGQRATFTRGSEVTHFALDSRNRLAGQANPDGSALSWSYDAAGNRSGVAVSQSGALSQQITYTWTARNELSQVYRNGQLWATYSYDDVGNRRSLSYANGTTQTLAYNQKNQLLSIENRKASAEIISSYAYTLDPRGMRTAVLEDSGRTVAYAYDALKRLLQEQITETSGTTTIGYLLDRVGNRLQKQVIAASTQTTTYGYNADDELLTETGPDGLISYSYNANGETAQKSAAGQGVSTYSWDFEGRMIGALTPSESLAFGYDLDGIRTAKSVNGVLTRFVVDKNRDYAQVLEERDGGASTQVAYVYGDDLLTQERSTGFSFYHTDGQLSTRQLTDSSATITDRSVYDAFGDLLSATGSTYNSYRFGGGQYDSNLALYYLRARYFSDKYGRYVSADQYDSRDSDPATLHRYLYCGHDPVNHVDPSGQFGEEIAIAFGALSTLAQIAVAVVVLAVIVLAIWGIVRLLGGDSRALNDSEQAKLDQARTFLGGRQNEDVLGPTAATSYYVLDRPLNDNEVARNVAGKSITFNAALFTHRPVVIAVALYAEYQHVVKKADTEDVEFYFQRFLKAYIHNHTPPWGKGGEDSMLTPQEVQLLQGFHHGGQEGHSWTQNND